MLVYYASVCGYHVSKMGRFGGDPSSTIVVTALIILQNSNHYQGLLVLLSRQVSGETRLVLSQPIRMQYYRLQRKINNANQEVVEYSNLAQSQILIYVHEQAMAPNMTTIQAIVEECAKTETDRPGPFLYTPILLLWSRKCQI